MFLEPHYNFYLWLIIKAKDDELAGTHRLLSPVTMKSHWVLNLVRHSVPGNIFCPVSVHVYATNGTEFDFFLLMWPRSDFFFWIRSFFYLDLGHFHLWFEIRYRFVPSVWRAMCPVWDFSESQWRHFTKNMVDSSDGNDQWRYNEEKRNCREKL